MDQDFWSKRGLFREWVSDLKALKNWTNAQVAEAIGLAPLSLKKYLSNSATHKPGNEALKRLGDHLGRDYRLLHDEPGVAPVSISEESWSRASERDRVLASAMLEDLMAIPEEEKEIYYQLWKQGVAIGKARMAAEAKNAGEGRGGKKG